MFSEDLLSKLQTGTTKALFLIMLIGVYSEALIADSFRCGRKVVKTGDTSAYLLKKCGQPQFKDRAYEQIKTAEGRQKVRVERWYYQKSTRSLSRAVWIYRGTIVAIDTS